MHLGFIRTVILAAILQFTLCSIAFGPHVSLLILAGDLLVTFCLTLYDVCTGQRHIRGKPAEG